MKKKFTLIVFFFSFFFLHTLMYTQILNSGFESWNSSEPTNWITSNIPDVFNNVIKSSNYQEGTASAKMEIVNYFNLPWPASLYSGDDNYEGHPISERYTSLKGYFRSDLKSTAQFFISVFMTDTTSGAYGVGSHAITSSLSNWTEIIIPIDYFDENTPDYCIIQFTLYDSTEINDLSTVGSYVEIDNLSLDYITDIVYNEEPPKSFAIYQNYPNPFNPTTTINFSLPFLSNTKVMVYNSIGEIVKILSDKPYEQGYHQILWNAEDLPSGTYFIKISASSFANSEQFVKVIKTVLLK